MKILITGATGNVGREIIISLNAMANNVETIAAVSNIEKAKNKLCNHPVDEFRIIDFEDASTFNSALDNIDVLFLLRPPHIADIKRYFVPLFNSMKQKGVNKIVFLSVQGVETQKKIPHYKLEQTILEYGFEYVFLRPSYFMQNLTTTLKHEIVTEDRIFIPAGNLKMNWVDVQDIGRVGSHVLNEFSMFRNTKIEITGSEFIGFKKVADMLSQVTGRQINYESSNLFKFFIHKRKQGMKAAMIFVMIMLHYLPRFSGNKERLVDSVKQITDKEPTKLIDFLKRERKQFS